MASYQEELLDEKQIARLDLEEELKDTRKKIHLLTEGRECILDENGQPVKEPKCLKDLKKIKELLEEELEDIRRKMSPLYGLLVDAHLHCKNKAGIFFGQIGLLKETLARLGYEKLRIMEELKRVMSKEVDLMELIEHRRLDAFSTPKEEIELLKEEIEYLEQRLESNPFETELQKALCEGKLAERKEELVALLEEFEEEEEEPESLEEFEEKELARLVKEEEEQIKEDVARLEEEARRLESELAHYTK